MRPCELCRDPECTSDGMRLCELCERSIRVGFDHEHERYMRPCGLCEVRLWDMTTSASWYARPGRPGEGAAEGSCLPLVLLRRWQLQPPARPIGMGSSTISSNRRLNHTASATVLIRRFPVIRCRLHLSRLFRVMCMLGSPVSLSVSSASRSSAVPALGRASRAK